LVLSALFGWADLCFARNYLLYFEAQAVGGYSSQEDRAILYSLSPEESMQKPSLGFDFLQRFSTEDRDFGALAIQGRLALNATGKPAFEPQLYNAYFKYKAGFADLWAGHSRPALGLSSYFDSHGLLLPTLAMQGFGFDRDWGVGLYRDLAWGNVSLSATTGSGMPVQFKGNSLWAARVSKGVLSQENYNLGCSAAYGQVLETMGYHLMDPDPHELILGGADFTFLWENLENRWDCFLGKKMGKDTLAFFWRSGINLLEEGRLRLEFQPVYWRVGKDWTYQLFGGISYQATGDLAVRAMYRYDRASNDQRIVFQVYYYKRL
jgi:opacity protein-like surface antigen